jgi:hypothetical protein
MNTNASLEGALDAGDFPNPSVAPVSRRRSLPPRTLMVCFTVWLIATEVLIFDQIRFNAKVELVEQATRAFRGPQLLVPSERPSNLPGAAKMEKL